MRDCRDVDPISCDLHICELILTALNEGKKAQYIGVLSAHMMTRVRPSESLKPYLDLMSDYLANTLHFRIQSYEPASQQESIPVNQFPNLSQLPYSLASGDVVSVLRQAIPRTKPLLSQIDLFTLKKVMASEPTLEQLKAVFEIRNLPQLSEFCTITMLDHLETLDSYKAV